MQGLHPSELTLAEHLKKAGYATASIGKWHLGGRSKYRPQRQGFDEFYGVLYSNNMVWIRSLKWPRLELFDGARSVESPADVSLLTRRYTHRAVEFVERNRDKPFFLYLSYTMPHLPLAASAEFAGRSDYGLYGDVIEELDASVGQLLSVLAEAGLDECTYTFFTSDNGPWTGDGAQRGGSNGKLRGRKGTTWEGGLRIPFIARAPGRLPTGEIRSGAATLMDVFPTISALANARLPRDRSFDGANILAWLRGDEAAPERDLFFSSRRKVFAVRSGPWKLHLRERALDRKGRPRRDLVFERPQLYRLDLDPAEERDLAAKHGAIVDRLARSAAQFQGGIEPTVRLRPLGLAIVRGLLTPAP